MLQAIVFHNSNFYRCVVEQLLQLQIQNKRPIRK